MITNRPKENESEIKQYSIKSHMHQIDQAIAEISVQFTYALGDGASKPEGAKKIQVALFQYLWKKLNDQHLIFDSLSELDIYYGNFSEKLDIYIADFFSLTHGEDQSRGENQELPANKRKLFLDIIKLYHTLAKIKFLLSRIEFLDLKKAFDSISFDFSYAELSPVKETIDLLDALNEEIPAKLSSSGYSKSQSVQKKIKKLDEELLPFISSLLSKLPTANQLNAAIRNLRDAAELKNKHGMSQNIRILNEYIIQIQETKKMISQKILSFLQTKKICLDEIIKEQDSIKARIVQIEQQDFFRVLRILSSVKEQESWQEIFREIIKESKQQSERWFTNGPWEQTSKKLEILFKNLDENYSHLMKGQVALVANINKLIVFIRALNSRREQLEEVSHLLEDGVNKLHSTWQIAEQDIIKVENTLINHLEKEESILTYCSSFLGRHWWKMLLSGAGGGSGASGIAILLALKGGPLAVICVIGVVIGTSLGAGSGVVSDYYCPGKQKEPEPERELLLSEEFNHEVIEMGEDPVPINTTWLPAFSIWRKSKNDTPLEKEHRQEFKLKPFT